MLELSDIQASPEELENYYAELGTQHVTPACIGGGISLEPRSEAVLVRMLGFYEEYNQERQELALSVNASQWNHPMSEMRAALQRLTTANTGNSLEYSNRRTGGPVIADDRLPYAIAAPPREDADAPSRFLDELSRGRRRRLLGSGRPAARLGRQGRVDGADLDLLRACQ